MPEPRGTARDILLRIERESAWAGPLLERAAGAFADPRDAALTRELVLGVLRWRAGLDHVLARFSRRPVARLDPEVRATLRVGAYALLKLDRVPDFATVDRAVESIKRGPKRSAAGYVNAVLRQVARAGCEHWPPEPRPGDVGSLALAASQPAWWVGKLVEREGWDAAVALLNAANRPAGLTLKPHPGRTTSAALAGELVAAGRHCSPGRFAPDALRLAPGEGVDLEPLRAGRAWAQDEASQLVPALFGEHEGLLVDACAAPGGKALSLAAAGGGPVLACDLRAARLDLLRQNVRRTGLTNVLPLAADMTGPYPFRSPVARILVDAPCTGTGTMRRNPEIRWRLSPADPERLAALQSRLLDRAVAHAAPRATIVYSVCSLEPEEGEGVVSTFLQRHPGFVVADARDFLPPAAHDLVNERGAMETRPSQGIDGFFAVRLDRGL